MNSFLADKADIADLGDLADKDFVNWNTDIENKPETFPPSTHNHDDRYYTEDETNALLAEKLDTADVGTMSEVNDAPSDNKEYVRKNGQWAIATGGISSVAWGDITGSISSQTDLQTALNAKANSSDLGDLASKNSVDWDTDITDIPQSFPPSSHDHDDRYYTESETDTLLNAKANSADLGDLAVKDKVDWDTDIDDIPQSFPPSAHTHDDRYYTEDETNALLNAKAPLDSPTFTGTPTAPTAAVSTDTTQLATCEFVHKKGLYQCSGSIPAGSAKTFSNANITSTMKIVGDVARFSDPTKVTTDVNYTVSDGSITFTGTFTDAVTIYFDLMEFDTLTLT